MLNRREVSLQDDDGGVGVGGVGVGGVGAEE